MRQFSTMMTTLSRDHRSYMLVRGRGGVASSCGSRSPMHLVGQTLLLEAITTRVSCSFAFSHSGGENHLCAGRKKYWDG